MAYNEAFEMEDYGRGDDDYQEADPEYQEDEPEYQEPETEETTLPSTDIPPPPTEIIGNQIRDKIEQLYAYLGAEGNVGRIDVNDFRIVLNDVGGVTLEVRVRGRWLNLTNKNTGEFLARDSIKTKMGGGVAMANRLALREQPDFLKRSVAAAEKLNRALPSTLEGIPMRELNTQIGNVTREISTNTDLDMREILGLDKALQRIQGELENNSAKLTEIDAHIAREKVKLAELNDPSYSEELRTKIRGRLTDLQAERSARLEVLSQNRTELQSQFARIRQTIEKVLSEDTTLAERVKTIFREQGVTIAAVLTAFGLIISTIVTSLTGGSVAGALGGAPKNIGNWVKDKLKALARVLGRLAGKAAAALPGIIGSIIAGILNFLKKTVGFIAEHTWMLVMFLASLVGAYLLSKIGKK